MNYIRGNRKDFDHWEALGNPGWSYDDVLPYFIKSEKNLQIYSVDQGYHGMNGYMPVSQFRYEYQFEKDLIEGARQTGQIVRDINGVSEIGLNLPKQQPKTVFGSAPLVLSCVLYKTGKIST